VNEAGGLLRNLRAIARIGEMAMYLKAFAQRLSIHDAKGSVGSRRLYQLCDCLKNAVLAQMARIHGKASREIVIKVSHKVKGAPRWAGQDPIARAPAQREGNHFQKILVRIMCL